MKRADRRRMHANMAADVARRAGFPKGCPHAKRGKVTVCVECLAQSDYRKASPMAGAILGIEFYRERAAKELAR